MTSINVMRLSENSGLLVCDEARYWNPEWMIFYTPEKIRCITDSQIQKEQKIVMFMGQTGSSSVGDEWIEETRRRISQEYALLKSKSGKIPAKFKSLSELAELTFDNITQIKHAHINDFIQGKFGFTQDTVVTGKYLNKDQEISISDSRLLENARNYMDFTGTPEEVKGIFGNSQILAGYTPEEGFKIFYMTERWPVCEEVHEMFLAQGSGRDTCDLEFARYADTRTLKQRRLKAFNDPAEGLMTLLSGLNRAMNLTAGIGGYPKIIYVNGEAESSDKWVKEICDRRSRLAAEIVASSDEGLIEFETARNLVESLIFADAPFERINKTFFNATRRPEQLFRFLRGYPNP